MPSDRPHQLLGVRIDPVGWGEIEEFCRRTLGESTSKHIVTVNGEIILTAWKNPQLKKAINESDLVIPDSTNVVWIGRLKGIPFRGVTPGSDLALKLAQIAQEMGKSIFLLGAAPGVAAKAAARLREQFPNLQIAGVSSTDPDDTASIQEITEAHPDIVLVAYGAPAQEIWIQKNREKTGAKLLVGVGGTFDMLAGTLPRAPRWLRLLHLEWLWRLCIQPSRWKRIWNAVVVFPLTALVH